MTIEFNLAPSSFNHKYTTLGGYKYHYVEEGDPTGPTIVLIHGFPDIWFGWRYQIRHLAAQGYHVIAIDNLGSGESEVVRCVGLDVQPYRSKNLAKNLMELLDRLKVDKAVIVGHDWGAIIAWKVGLHFPERCHAIISVGIPHRAPTKEYISVEEIAAVNPPSAYLIFFEKKAADDYFDTNVVAQLGRMYSSDPDRKDPIGTGQGTSKSDLQYYIDTFRKSGFHGQLNYYRSFRLNWEDELPFVGKPYTVPSLLLVIKGDAVVPQTFVDSVPRDCFTDLEVGTIEKGTHFCLTENPEEVNAALDRYLGKLKARQIIHTAKKA